MFTIYADYAIDLIVDAAAIFLLAYVLYFRRHRRADLLLGYVALNIGIFVAMSLLGKVRVDIALGFGLFAILSIIRLRSTSVTQQEVAYYFIALVMGLVNGLDIDDRRLVVIVNVLLIATMAIVDSRPMRDRARRMDVHLDVIHADDAALVADLERRLGGTVMHHEVNDVDYVRDTMIVDVRYRAGTVAAQEKVDDRRLEVTLDVIHTDDAALVADLERRLGGRVLRHQVKDVDYVRDTMVVDVRYRVWSRFPARTAAVPTQSQPTQPQPTQARPTQSQPTQARPAQPGPTQPRPQPQPQPQAPVQVQVQVPVPVQPTVARPQFTGRGVDERTAAVK